MAYLPTPATLAALGFGPVHEYPFGPYASGTYSRPNEQTVVLWSVLAEVRLCVPDGTGPTKRGWRYLFTGPVADEAALDALVTRHFPELIAPQI